MHTHHPPTLPGLLPLADDLRRREHARAARRSRRHGHSDRQLEDDLSDTCAQLRHLIAITRPPRPPR